VAANVARSADEVSALVMGAPTLARAKEYLPLADIRPTRKSVKDGESCRSIAKTFAVHHATIASLAAGADRNYRRPALYDASAQLPPRGPFAINPITIEEECFRNLDLPTLVPRCGGIAMRSIWASVIAFMMVAIFDSDSAGAACVCRCVNGQMQPLCSSSIEVPPICPPTVSAFRRACSHTNGAACRRSILCATTSAQPLHAPIRVANHLQIDVWNHVRRLRAGAACTGDAK
jgi:hypothetical protein